MRRPGDGSKVVKVTVRDMAGNPVYTFQSTGCRNVQDGLQEFLHRCVSTEIVPQDTGAVFDNTTLPTGRQI